MPPSSPPPVPPPMLSGNFTNFIMLMDHIHLQLVTGRVDMTHKSTLNVRIEVRHCEHVPI